MWRQILTLLAIAGAFVMNLWSNVAPVGGLNIGEIADTFFDDVRVLPASYAFAIWGLIYLGLFAFGIYQALPAQRHHGVLRRIDYWIVIASVAQIVWVFLFLLRLFALSVVAMLVILVALAIAFWQIKTNSQRPSRHERWFIHAPVGIYLGWISVATIVNIASALDAANWQGGGISPTTWAVLLCLISGAIATIILWQHHDFAFPGVIVWALVAIGVRQSDNSVIVSVAIGVAIALALFMLVVQVKPKTTKGFGSG